MLNNVTSKSISDEVEDLGFGAELINTFEIRQEEVNKDTENGDNSVDQV